jgi:hypothetical protein
MFTVALILSAAACDNNAAPPTASTASSSTSSAKSGSSAPPRTAAPSSTTATATSISGTDEEQIRATINAFWSEWLLAGDPPDPDRESFTRLITGDALQRETDNLRTKRAVGESRRQPPNSAFRHVTLSVSISGSEADLVECVVDDTLVVDTADGTVRNSAVSTVVLAKKLRVVDGTWRIAESTIQEEFEGVRPCAAG